MQVSRPKAWLELLAGKEMTEAVASVPFYQELTSKPKFKEFLNSIKFLETALETDWRTGLARLTGGGITLAVCPQDTVVAIVDAEEERILERLHEIFLNIARTGRESRVIRRRVASKDYGGVTAWTFDGKEAMPSSASGLSSPIARRVSRRSWIFARQGEARALTAKPAFQAAREQQGRRLWPTVFVNLKPLMGIPKIAAASSTSSGRIRWPRWRLPASPSPSQLELAEPGDSTSRTRPWRSGP